MALTLRSCMGAGYQTQHGEDGHDGRCTVAEERQGQTDNGHNTDAHAYIDHHLEHQCRACTEADQTAHVILAFHTNIKAPGNDRQLQAHDEHTAQKAQFFAHGGEDIVRMLGVQVAALGTVAVEQALASETTTGKGLEVDFGMVSFIDTLGINGGVKQNQDSVSLIFAQELS